MAKGVPICDIGIAMMHDTRQYNHEGASEPVEPNALAKFLTLGATRVTLKESEADVAGSIHHTARVRTVQSID
jgi:hypothetical protein